ncbi:MAG: hypothetical protein LBU47_02455 [Christensenellaceae bacterium]|jgi:anti-sigma regulatory factor (Ser/Thr protein kinase)|nr:hypothetical protein [Christensenellaceae bacterium]
MAEEGAYRLHIPAREEALFVVRLTASGVAAGHEVGMETLEDLKTAVYEACYAMMHQKLRPAGLCVEFRAGGDFAVRVSAEGPTEETDGREIDPALCRAVLETVISEVEIEADESGIRVIAMRHRP